MQTKEALHAFFTRAIPVVPELFNMAYAICGNYDLAEYSLQYTLVEVWLGESRVGIGFREDLRRTLRRVAEEEALGAAEEPTEFTWNGLTVQGDEITAEVLAQETPENLRAAVLHYGCGLHIRQIARLTGLSAAKIKEILNRTQRETAKKLPAGERRRAELRLVRSISKALAQPSREMPSVSGIYRTFQSEARQTRRSKHLASKIIQKVILVILALLCAVMFWLAAVLIQPTPMENPMYISAQSEQ